MTGPLGVLLLATSLNAPARPAEEPNPYGYGYIGVTILTDAAKKQVSVNTVTDGFPAKLAGIKTGDVIVSINGYPATDSATLIGVVSAIRPGQVARTVVRRRDDLLTIDIVTSERPKIDLEGDVLPQPGPPPLGPPPKPK